MDKDGNNGTASGNNNYNGSRNNFNISNANNDNNNDFIKTHKQLNDTQHNKMHHDNSSSDYHNNYIHNDDNKLNSMSRENIIKEIEYSKKKLNDILEYIK